jgi:signal transduction histidine kinase
MKLIHSLWRNESGRGLRPLLLPVAGVVVTAILVMSVLVGFAARELNWNPEQDASNRLAATLSQVIDESVENTLEFIWWDESVKRIVILFDESWASNLWGSYQESFRDVDVVVALNAEGETIMTWQRGFMITGRSTVDFGPGLDLLIESANARSVANPIPSAGWLWVGDELYLVVVGAITPSDPVWASSTGATRGAGVFARSLREILDRTISNELILPDLRIVDAASADALLVLDGPGGSVTAGLTWNQELPGNALLRTVVLPVGIGLLLMIPLMILFFGRAERMVREADQLESKLQEERELSELKGRFVSMVSHEFRTPLASIMAASEMLTHYSDRMDDAQRGEELVSIGNDVDRLTAMLDKVVALQRSDSDLFDLDRKLVDAAQLIRRIIDKTVLATKGGHDVLLQGGEDVGIISVDAQLLEHILSNLISNAIKYSPDRSHIDVTISRDEGMLRLEVSDHGIGIPPAELKEIGTPFYRAGNTGSVSGTGLGLAIVTRAAERHGGNLTIESELGQGTRVVVCIMPGTLGPA